MINDCKQEDQGNKCTLPACRSEDIEETPVFWDLQYPLWVVNADLLVDDDSAGFFPKWLFDVLMLGKDLIFYGDADVVHHIGCNMQRLWCMERDKDRTTAPFYHASCRCTLGCRVLLQGTCISLTTIVCGLEQRVAEISRYICFSHWFRCRSVRKASRNAVSGICLYSSHFLCRSMRRIPLHVSEKCRTRNSVVSCL